MKIFLWSRMQKAANRLMAEASRRGFSWTISHGIEKDAPRSFWVTRENTVECNPPCFIGRDETEAMACLALLGSRKRTAMAEGERSPDVSKQNS